MLAYFVVRHGDVDMYDKRDGAQRNAMQPSTRCTAQRKKHIIYSCNNIYNNFSRMFFSNFFYNSPISTVVIILPSQAMHMLRANHSKLSFCGAWSRQAHLCRGAWCAVTGIAAAGRCHPPLVLVVCPNETCWDEHVWFDFVNLSIQGRKCKDACSHNPRCPKVMHTS